MGAQMEDLDLIPRIETTAGILHEVPRFEPRGLGKGVIRSLVRAACCVIVQKVEKITAAPIGQQQSAPAAISTPAEANPDSGDTEITTEVVDELEEETWPGQALHTDGGYSIFSSLEEVVG